MKRKLLLVMAFVASIFGANAQTWTGSEPAEGTFFLYNVGTQKFINVGDKSAGWGTNAYITAEYGLDFIFEANGEAYNLNSQVSNGGTSNYLATGMWCDGAATPWTFTKVDRTDINAYTISNGGSYIVANAAGTDVEYTALSGTERDQWQIIGSADILANLQANTAAGVKRTQATFFISDPDFGRNDLRMSANKKVWQYTYSTGGNVTIPGRGLGLGADGNQQNYGCEFWNNTFDIHQDLTDLPNGIYEFEIYGIGTEGSSYVYATTTEGTTEKTFKNTDSKGYNFQTVLNNIDQFSGNVTGLVQVKDGKLTIGVKRDATNWTVIDQARLYYYGDYTFADAYGADLKVLITTAQGLVAAAPIAAMATDLSAAITAAQDVVAKGQTEQDFADGQAALQSAVDAYNAKLALTQRYFDIRNAARAIATNLDVAKLDANILAATTVEEVNSIIANLRAAFLAELPNVQIPADGYIDVTAVMVENAGVHTNTDYWTIEGTKNGNYSFGVCNYNECEFYNCNFKFYQTLALTPGTWEFGVTGFHRAGNHNTHFYAGEDKILIPGVANTVVNSMAEAETYFNDGNGKVALKFLVEAAANIEIGIDNQDTETDKWTIFRDFTLKYYGAPDYSIYDQQWTDAVTAANDALDAQAYKYVSGSERTAVTNAIADAPDGSSKANYLEKIQTLEAKTAAFTAAAPSYNAFVAEKAIAEMIGVETSSYAAPTSAAEAAAAVNTLKVAEYNYVADKYTFSATGVIGDFGSWTGTATYGTDKTPSTPNYLSNEHWSGQTHAYYEQCSQGWGNAGGWTIKYEKTCILPAGDYMIKVAARSSEGTTSLVSCSATANTVTLPNNGASTRGINTNGVASWSDSDTFARGGENNEGFGWEWRFLPFTLTEETEVTMTFYAEASSLNQWMSIADGELLSASDIATPVAYNEAATNTINDVNVANVTITRNIKQGFNTVVLPFNLTANQVTTAFGAGTEVYVFSEDSSDPEDVTINFWKNDGSINANTPVLVKATAESNSQLFEGVQIVAAAEAKVEGTNVDFVGVYAPATVEAGDYFVGNGALYKSTGATTIKGFRAYLKTKAAQSGEVKLFIDGIATGINAINGVEAEQGAIFNLAGQRVQKAQKGIYVINGKKVLVK